MPDTPPQIILINDHGQFGYFGGRLLLSLVRGSTRPRGRFGFDDVLASARPRISRDILMRATPILRQVAIIHSWVYKHVSFGIELLGGVDVASDTGTLERIY